MEFEILHIDNIVYCYITSTFEYNPELRNIINKYQKFPNSLGCIVLNLYPDHIYINNIDIYAQTYSKYSTPEERQRMKGMGFRMIQFSLTYVLHSYTSNTIVKLDAMSANCYSQHSLQSTRIEPRTFEECIRVLDTYKNDKRLYSHILDDIECSAFLCQVDQNKKLISYYERMGFRVVDPDSIVVVQMESTIGILI